MNENDASQDVVIERTFDAPVELVWQLWTDPEHFKEWYGPGGATIPVAEMDVRVGGKRLLCMAMDTPGGPMEMWFTGEYLEVVAHERLVFTDSMSDEHGDVLSAAEAGMPEGHPTTTQVTVELEAIGNGSTRMVLTHAGVPAGSPGAAGWHMALDKLAAIVELR